MFKAIMSLFSSIFSFGEKIAQNKELKIPLIKAKIIKGSEESVDHERKKDWAQLVRSYRGDISRKLRKKAVRRVKAIEDVADITEVKVSNDRIIVEYTQNGIHNTESII